MEGFGFNPQYPPGSRVDSMDRTHSFENSSESSDEYRNQVPRHQQTSLKRDLSERSIGMPSSAMTSRYARIRSGIAGLADEIRGLGLALSPKETESLGSFLIHLDGAHVEALAQNLEELLMAAGIPDDQSENLKARVSLIRTRLQSAGRDKDYGLNGAQLLFTRIKDDLSEIAKALEAVSTSSNAEKAAVLGALQQIQAIESKIAMLVASAQGDYQPMLIALKQMLANLDVVELGLNSLNPVGTYGIVSSSVEHTVVELPPCGKPELDPPEVCDLQRSVFDLRACIGLLEQELGKKNIRPQVCRQQVSGIMGRLQSLAEDAAMLERASAEVQEKARTGISLAQIVRGLSFLTAGISGGCRGLQSGLSRLLGRGQAWLVSAGRCCNGFTRLLNSLLSGIIWSAKGLGFYAGVAMLTPVFLIKKLAENDTPWWSQPLPANSLLDLPEGMEVYDPLKSPEAFNAMYQYLTEHDFEDEVYVEPELPVTPVFDPPPAPSLATVTPQTEFTDSLQMHMESLESLEEDLASESVGTVHLAQESLTDHQLEMTRLENEFERLSPLMTGAERSVSQQSLQSCRELVDSCTPRSLTPQTMLYDSFGQDGSFIVIDEESIELPGSDFHKKVIQAYKEQWQLSVLFKQAEDVHMFLQQQLPVLGRMVSAEELQLITLALEQLKALRLKQEAHAVSSEAFGRRFRGRFRESNRGPNMRVDRDEVVSRVQDSLVKEIDQVTARLGDMLPREQMATDSQDWQFIKEKACSMALLDRMKEYLDDASLLWTNLHYFTGHDLSESDIESRVSGLNEKLEYQIGELEKEKSVTRDRLESAERHLENIDTKLSELKSKMADLYFEGWIGQNDPAFDELEQGRELVRQQRSKILKHYEQIVDPDVTAVRKRMHSKLKNLSEDLKQKLSSSGRRADIDHVVALLETDADEWTKENWLHLNWMCHRYSSMLRKTVFENYATVSHMAHSIGYAMQNQLQAQINAFDLCTSGDVEDTMETVWAEWERDHADSIEELLADPLLRRMHEETEGREILFNVRASALNFARQACRNLSRGMMRPPSEISAVERFYQDVVKHGASKTTAFDRAVRTLDPKQYQEALQQILKRMKSMENDGKVCFPVIKTLAEMEDDSPVELGSCGFDDITRWTQKKLGHYLEAAELEELMIMYMQFRDQLRKQVSGGN